VVNGEIINNITEKPRPSPEQIKIWIKEIFERQWAENDLELIEQNKNNREHYK
jgi:hypothetical protein